jgi:hypothetical protein
LQDGKKPVLFKEQRTNGFLGLQNLTVFVLVLLVLLFSKRMNGFSFKRG